MQNYFLGMLLIAWILSLFNFDEIFVKGINELFNKEITIAAYYVIFLGIGVVIDLICLLKK